MEIEQWPIGNLKPYSKNPRKISQQAIDKVAASIKAFGFRQAIVVDAKGVIVVGHTRWQAAKKLGLKTVPVHVAADLTEQQAKAYRLADNRVAQESSWMDDMLTAEMTDLFEEDFDLTATGFNPDEIAFMFGIELEPEADTAAAADGAVKYKLTLEFDTQEEQQTTLREMQERGVKCKASP
jgi:ParB-like chromosome segregation protein Spo0J